jgi:hypothetical protein
VPDLLLRSTWPESAGSTDCGTHWRFRYLYTRLEGPLPFSSQPPPNPPLGLSDNLTHAWHTHGCSFHCHGSQWVYVFPSTIFCGNGCS